MARKALFDHPSAVRTLGAAFVALMVLLVYLTYAVFSKTFVDSDAVTISASKTGLQLPKNADVKLLGMAVGEVRSVESTEDGVKLNVAMFPDKIGDVPGDVSALIVPKTLFGEKYVALQAPGDADNGAGPSLRAGDNIAQAKVPIEVETVLNDLYPLLETVQPQEISYTLNAVATALEGRGDDIGDNLARLDRYIAKINPLVPQLVDDIDKLGQVSDQYADVMPELGRLLRNTVVTGNTIVAKKAQLQAFFDETTALSNTTTSFLRANEDNLIGLSTESEPSLALLAEYSEVFPCLTKAVASQVPRYNNLFRGQELHINLELIPEQDQPTAYAPGETPIAPTKEQADADQKNLGPSCHSLPDSPYNQEKGNLAPIPDYSVYQKTGLEDPEEKHNKFRTAPGASLIDMIQPSMGGLPGEKDAINALIAPTLNMSSKSVPDVASLMIAPVLRGSGVKISEAP